MSKQTARLQEERPQEEPEQGPGDIHALVAEMQADVEASVRERFAHVERALARSVAERFAGADALIARLSAENARLLEENARQQRTLARMRELALAGG